MSVLAKKIAEKIRFLDGIETTEYVICSHFGEHISHANLSINIGTYHRGGGRLLITLYDNRCRIKGFVRGGRKTDDGDTWIGFSKKIHDARASSISKAINSPIIDKWNGEDGHNGVSIVLERLCPQITLTGIKNYINLRSPFNLSDAEKLGFENYRSALKKHNDEIRLAA